MGNCVSCTEPSSHEQPDRWLTDGDKKITEIQAPGGTSTRASGGMSRRNNEGGGGPSRDSFGNGSYTPGSTSTPLGTHHNYHQLSPPADGVASGPLNLSTGQKAEKKTFYSRIPPLGRSGSDKKNSLISNSTSSTIKDNNNAYSEVKIATVFELYKDPNEDLILAEGIEKLCKDLEVKPEDFKVLVLAWKFGAEQMCRFTREEFYRGMRELKTDNIKGIQARLPDCVAEVLSDAALFKELYRFAFRFGLDTELGQRILPIEMAVSLWRVVFSQREPPLLGRWILFLDSHPHIRGIPRDTWNMFLNLVETVDNDLSTYDDTEAWPSLFDDFVEYENDRLNQNLTSTANNVLAVKSDQQNQYQPNNDYNASMMSTTIPPPANFSDTSLVRVVTSPTAHSHPHHHHHHQLMSIDTSSNSGYTKIIHSHSSSVFSSNNASNAFPSDAGSSSLASCSAIPLVVSSSSYSISDQHAASACPTSTLPSSPTPSKLARVLDTAKQPSSNERNEFFSSQAMSSPAPPYPFGDE